MRFVWDIEGQTIRVDLNLLSGRETVSVESTTVYNEISWKLRNEIPVPLRSGDSAHVVVSLGRFLLPRAQLIVAGSEVEPRPSARDNAAPWWGWIFVAACVLIPIATLGGAIPAAIGLLGAGLNHLVARQDWPAFPRVVLMSIVTSAAWLITIAVVFGIHLLLGEPRTQ